MALWLAYEDQQILKGLADGYEGYLHQGGSRTYDSYQKRRQQLVQSGAVPLRRVSPTVLTDEPLPEMGWRDALKVAREMQNLKSAMIPESNHKRIVVETDKPIVVMALGDTHLGSWGVDYDLFERVTDEILAVPNLYLILLGDMVQNAIHRRSVVEDADNLLPVPLQESVLASWLDELSHKVLCSVLGNHESRQETLAGSSSFAAQYRVLPAYFPGIGHADVTIGNQTYRIAVSHRFPSRSKGNPVYGPQSYLCSNPSREIALAGDSHVPGVMSFHHEREKKLAINCGTVQINSEYAARNFSLHTHPVFPVFSLDPDEHLFTGYWSLRDYLRR